MGSGNGHIVQGFFLRVIKMFCGFFFFYDNVLKLILMPVTHSQYIL